MRLPLLALAAAAALTSACATTTELTPAPGALRAAGPGQAAQAAVSGVRVVASAEAWSGFPQRLDEVTPLLVALHNDSGVPVRVRYDDFQLVSARGTRYAALPPFAIDESEVVAVGYVDPWPGFSVAPWHAGYFPGWRSAAYPLRYDPFYYDAYRPAYARVALPTEDMLRRALPEGVIEPGGTVRGFLYFQQVDDDEGRVDFTFRVFNALTGEPMGVVTIPFTVD